MVGGMVSATILTLIVIPALFLLWRGRSIDNGGQSKSHEYFHI
jgi:Cu(I)/Ag(I) efflux system membrane protein CusA/SilA